MPQRQPGTVSDTCSRPDAPPSPRRVSDTVLLRSDLLRLLGGVGEALEELPHLLLLVVQVLLVVPQALDELLAVREAPAAATV